MQLQINLASRAYVNRRGLYGFYALFGGLLVVLLAFNINYLLRLRAHTATLSTQLAEMAVRAGSAAAKVEVELNPAEVEKRRRDVAFANEILQRDGFRWTALLDNLENLLVDGVGIRSVQPNFKENSLGLTAVARDIRPMQSFLDNLLASPSFSEVYLLNQTASKDPRDPDGEGQEIAFSLALKGVF